MDSPGWELRFGVSNAEFHGTGGCFKTLPLQYVPPNLSRHRWFCHALSPYTCAALPFAVFGAEAPLRFRCVGGRTKKKKRLQASAACFLKVCMFVFKIKVATPHSMPMQWPGPKRLGGIAQKSKIKISIFEFSSFRDFRVFDFFNGFLNFRIFEIFGIFEFSIFFADFWIFEFSSFRIFEFSSFRAFRLFEFSTFRFFFGFSRFSRFSNFRAVGGFSNFRIFDFSSGSPYPHLKPKRTRRTSTDIYIYIYI